MTDDLKLVERLRWDGVICPPHEMPPDTDPNITALAGFANEATVHGKTALRALEMLANQGTAIRRLVHELGEARNNLIQARNERDEDRQQRRDLHARYAVEISAMRADRERLVRERDEGHQQAAPEDQWFTDRHLPILAVSGDAEDRRVLRLHFRRDVTKQDRDDLVEAMNARLKLETVQAERDRLAKLVAGLREALKLAAAQLAHYEPVAPLIRDALATSGGADGSR